MQEVIQSQLESGKQYYIESLSVDKNNNNNTYCIHKRWGTFINLKSAYIDNIDGQKYEAHFKYFRKIDENISDGYDVELHHRWWRYYEVKKYRIQQNMETRVCDIMLRNITGDKYFKSGF